MDDTLAAIKVNHTATGTMEVHLLSFENLYRSVNVSSGTAITLADAPNFGFFSLFSDGDVMAIKTLNTAGTVEVHVLTADSGYSRFDAQEESAITQADAQNFVFRSLNGSRDLVGIKTRNAESGMVEVHIVTRSSGYKDFAVHKPTSIPLSEAGNYLYFITDDGLVCFKVRNTANVVASLLTASSGYQTVAFRTDMNIPAAETTFDTFTSCFFQGGGIFPPLINIAQIIRPRFRRGLGAWFEVRVSAGHNVDGGRYTGITPPLMTVLPTTGHPDFVFAGI